MATKPEIERLAVLETEVTQQGEDIVEIKGDVKAIRNSVEGLDKKFITRREVYFLISVLSLIVAVITALKGAK